MKSIFSRTLSLLLPAVLLFSSCSKETAVAPTPQPQAQAKASTTSGVLYFATSGQAAMPGQYLQISWIVAPYSGPLPNPVLCNNATVEFQLNGTTVLRALGQPITYGVDSRNVEFGAISYSIPAMLPRGFYTIVVRAEDPNTTLTLVNSGSYVTSLQDDLQIVANPATTPAYPTYMVLTNPYYTTQVPVEWDAQSINVRNTTGNVRIYFVASNNLIYDPGNYSYVDPLFNFGLTFNDGSENLDIRPIPDGKYSVLIGTVENGYGPGTTPAAYTSMTHQINIGSNVIVNPGPQ